MVSTVLRLSSFWIAALAAPVWAQGMAETAVVTVGSTAGAAGMSGVGKAIGGIGGRVAEVTGRTPARRLSASERARAAKGIIVIPPLPDGPPPNPVAPDAAEVKAGMEGAELVSKFGPPAMKVSSGAGETWSYGSAPEELVVFLKGGKVVSVTPPRKPLPDKPGPKSPPENRDSGIVILR